MMNSTRLNVLKIATLLLLLALPVLTQAAGPAPQVREAIPDNAFQGDQDVFMILKGRHFGPNVNIRFLLSGTDTEGLVDVDETTIYYNPDSGDLEFLIDVDEGADPIFYDIEVEILSPGGGRRGKGTDLFKVNEQGPGGGGGGGNENGDFDIVFSGDLSAIGTEWGAGNGKNNPPIGFYEDAATGVHGHVDLSYFLNGVFSGQRGVNCFGMDQPVNTAGGSVERRKRTGRAYSHLTWWGYTDDGSNITVKYIIHLWGQLIDAADWLPESHNTMIIDTWKIVLMDPYRQEYTNVACVGESTESEDFQTTIDIYRNN